MVEKRRLQFKILSHVCQLETAQNMLRGIFISGCQVEEPEKSKGGSQTILYEKI